MGFKNIKGKGMEESDGKGIEELLAKVDLQFGKERERRNGGR